MDFLYTVAIPVLLVLVMVGMGLSLTPADIKRVVVYPKAVSVGLLGQLLLLPLLAFVLAELLAPTPAIAAGAIILAACPGGVTSNAYTFAARADLALSVTLTAIESFITVFTIPLFAYAALYLYFDTGTTPEIDTARIITRLALLTIIPIMVGMTFRRLWPGLAAKLVESLRLITLYFLMFLIVAAAISSWRVLVDNLAQAGALVVALNLLSMSMGYGLGRVFALPKDQSITLTYEIGVQNLSLTLLVTLTLLDSAPLAITALLYAVVMPITAVAFLRFIPRLPDTSGLTQWSSAD